VNVSFTWTTDALLAGWKDTTRRVWSDQTLAAAVKAWRLNEPVHAFNKSTRNGGQHVASIILTERPRWSDELPPEDYDREGFRFLQRYGHTLDGLTPDDLWAYWSHPDARTSMVVVRYKVVSMTALGLERRDEMTSLGWELRPLRRAA